MNRHIHAQIQSLKHDFYIDFKSKLFWKYKSFDLYRFCLHFRGVTFVRWLPQFHRWLPHFHRWLPQFHRWLPQFRVNFFMVLIQLDCSPALPAGSGEAAANAAAYLSRRNQYNNCQYSYNRVWVIVFVHEYGDSPNQILLAHNEKALLPWRYIYH